jgi:NAD(P)-dependent dehydrogenase (short-subunit alcohol dehydrogenase family)
MDLGTTRALVTGGASGLGLAVAERIVHAGGRVAILDLQDRAGEAAAARLGGQSLYLRCDVSSEPEVSAAVAAAATAMGGLTLAVSCAGIVTPGRVLGREGPLDGAVFARVVAVNLLGTFYVDKAAAAIMQHNVPNADGERGLLIQTASVAAFEGQIGQAAYSASKAGVAGLTLPLARELARLGIRVVTIAPGLFATPMMDSLPEEARLALAAQVPFPARLGRPSEFADLVSAICANPMLNGETIRLDGAIRLQPK